MTKKVNQPTASGERAELVPEDQADETSDTKVQKSSTHGFWEDDALKRIVKQHPQKGIGQVESMEPAQAPPKE